jgi:5'-nucleotidase / UDP-sugar diphosphatase
VGAFTVPFGGFPRVTAKIKELESRLDNVVKVHAGDAITGTLFYTLFKGEADAALMNTACFDVFALGNHEFDDGDADLAKFLDFSGSNPAARHRDRRRKRRARDRHAVGAGDASDYIQPYAIKEVSGPEGRLHRHRHRRRRRGSRRSPCRPRSSSTRSRPPSAMSTSSRRWASTTSFS